MCGILGYFNLNNTADFNSEFSKSLEMLSHRGPDQFGVVQFKSKNTIGEFGHTRLSIIDLSENGNQPMKSKCGRYSLVFNGEIYNYKEIKKQLISEYNYEFNSSSDTEVLLASWSIWGKSSIRKFKGMFSFVIYDYDYNKLTCVRDAFGIKPFYYSIDSNNFYFSSEIPPILALNPRLKEVNYQKSFEYLLNGTYDDSEETFFKNIFNLKPCHILEINLKNKIKKTIIKWWNPEIKEIKISYKSATKKLREIFLENIKMHLRSDVPLGAALSGGIDSSSIVSCIRYIYPDLKINTFSFISEEAKSNEEKWVDIVNDSVKAKSYKLKSNNLNINSDLENLISVQGEPFGSTSIYAQYKLYEFVKKSGIIVTLDGQGADELLAGYGGYPIQRTQSLIDKFRIYDAFKFLNEWSKYPGRSLKLTVLGLFYDYLPISMKNFILYFKKKKLVPSYFDKQFLKNSKISIYKKNFFFNKKDIKGRRLVNKLKESLTGDGLASLLRHGDRNSMKWSVESRVPFLTTDLAEFLLTLPEDFLISDKGLTKNIFRNAMKGIVPKEILKRKDKIGFEPPENEWLASSRSIINETINEVENIPIFNSYNCKTLLNNYFKYPKSVNSRLVWRIINYAKWYSINFKN